MTRSLLANLIITAIQVVDWESVGDWFGNAGRGIGNGVRDIGRSFRSLFTKNRQASAVVVSENRVNINPSVKSSPNVQPLFTSSGGEFNFWDSFSKGFKGTFSGFKTLFTDPLSLIRPLSFSEAMQETMGMLMPGSKVTFAQLRANTVLSSGDVDGYAEIQGGLFGDVVLDGLSLVPVGRLAKFAKFGRAAKGGKAIVIGEGMSAVRTTAKTLQAQGINAKWYQAWSKNFPQGRRMTMGELDASLMRNQRWFNSKINQGYKIYDIGIDPKRLHRSPFYELETTILKQKRYPSTLLPRQ